MKAEFSQEFESYGIGSRRVVAGFDGGTIAPDAGALLHGEFSIDNVDEVDSLVCPRCGSEMKVIAFILPMRCSHAFLSAV